MHIRSSISVNKLVGSKDGSVVKGLLKEGKDVAEKPNVIFVSDVRVAKPCSGLRPRAFLYRRQSQGTVLVRSVSKRHFRAI